MKSFPKRNAVKQLACFLLAFMITAAFVPLPTHAYTQKYNYKVSTLKQKKWVTAKDYTYNYNQDKDTDTYTYYFYKISVPANSFIRVDSKNKSNSIGFYKSVNRKKDIFDQYCEFSLYDKNIYRRVLPKGTYYIRADEGTTFKWQSTKIKNPTNFCRSRSSRLKAGYKKWEVFNYGYEFDRWYRISLTARKPITVTMKQMDSNYNYYNSFSIYNSRGYKVTCNSLNDTNFRTTVLPKGTYYIRVNCGNYEDLFFGRISQFWWR